MIAQRRTALETPEHWAPLFIFATLTLAMYKGGGALWFGIFLPSLWLTLFFQNIRFCLSALPFLVFALMRHLWIPEGHLWSLGVETSLFTSLFLFSSGLKERNREGETLKAALEQGKQGEAALSASLLQEQQRRQEEAARLGGELSSLRKELEGKEEELASLRSLNGVLRGSFAHLVTERQAAEKGAFEQGREASLLKEELQFLEKEVQRLSDVEGVGAQNRQLFKELNEARVAKAQTQLINETLARLHAQSLVRTQELSQQILELEEGRGQELRRLAGELEQKGVEIQALSERLGQARDQVHEFAKAKPLLQQLKGQFEEKSQTLHETRKELFHTQTERERIERELQEFQQTCLSQELLTPLYQEIEGLESALFSLEEENLLLSELLQKWGKEGGELPSKPPLKKRKQARTQPELLDLPQ